MRPLLYLFVIVLCTLIAISLDNGEAKTITVETDGSGDYDNIQDAVQNATDGDVIDVGQGTFDGDVSVWRSVSVTGAGTTKTFIDLDNAVSYGLKITGDNVVVTGFNIKGSAGMPGYAIRIEAENVTVKNNVLASHDDDAISTWASHNATIEDNDCSDNYDSGINLMGSNDCIIRRNTCKNSGTGIYVDGSNRILIEDNKCKDNDYGGITLDDSGNCTIVNNTSEDNGWYGILLGNDDSDDNLVHHNECNGNSLSGIHLIQNCDDNLIHNNSCKNNGNEGIYIYYQCTNNRMFNNTIKGNDKGVRIREGCSGNLFHWNTIKNNPTYGIDVSENDGTVTNCTMNWWGTWFGPYHSTDHPQGDGDAISDDVLYEPWIGQGIRPPTVSLLSHDPEEEVTGEVHLFGNATPTDRRIRWIRISIEDLAWEDLIVADPWTYDWNSTSILTGRIKFRLVASDGHVNSTELIFHLLVNNKPGGGGGGGGGGDDDDDDGGIPGFGTELIIFTMIATLIIIRRRRD